MQEAENKEKLERDYKGYDAEKKEEAIAQHYKDLGLDVPDGTVPDVTPNDPDYTDGHGNDPYWNYETGQDDLPMSERPWYSVFKSVRYVVYFSLVAVPWILIGAALCTSNIIINIGFNDGWAAGNIFLISQTAYLLIQYFQSVLLYLEVDPWLKYMKFIRIGSLFMAWAYLMAYIAFSILLVVILDDLDGSEVTYMSMFTVMTLSYNLIFHTPVLLVNLMIVIKEISMEFLQFVNDLAGTGMDDYSLAAHNFLDMIVDITNWINPWWWAEAVEDPTEWDEMYE